MKYVVKLDVIFSRINIERIKDLHYLIQSVSKYIVFQIIYSPKNTRGYKRLGIHATLILDFEENEV